MEQAHQQTPWTESSGNYEGYGRESKSILNPPKSYIDYRCFVHDLSGYELESAQKKFYRDRTGDSKEIKEFFNWLVDQRNKENLPVERIRRFRSDGTKDPEAEDMMIYDIEYWLEGGRIKERKIYRPLLSREPGQEG